MPQEALRLIFDPFMIRTDTPLEYGINLMACYFIVHHHGGKIEAQSVEGKGTTFTICLPIVPDAQQAKSDDTQFMRKALMNDKLWQKLISTS